MVSPLWVSANKQCLVVKRRIAIAQLAGVLHFDRNPGQSLDHVLADQGRVPTGAAGGEHHASDRLQLVGAQIQSAENGRRRVLVQSTAHGIAHGLGLLVDLLEHEVGETHELDLGGVDLEV